MQTSSRDDAVQLNRAFKGLGCDTAVVVNVLGNRNASQRDSIQQEYEALFSDDLKKQLALELHGHLKVRASRTETLEFLLLYNYTSCQKKIVGVSGDSLCFAISYL